MVIRCGEEMREKLLRYLEEETVYNTFLLADICNFGFDKEFQTVYAEVEAGDILGVYLTFYQNLIIYSKKDLINVEFLSELFTCWAPSVVMGKFSNVKAVEELLPDFQMEEKQLYLLKDDSGLMEENEHDIQAVPGDEDDIYKFLMEFPQLRTLYASREMIGDRLKNQDGIHYYREEKGRIIAHVNSAAKSNKTMMIGGVAVDPEYRGQKLASALVSRICRRILKEGKQPCLFSDRNEEHNLYTRLGFGKIGIWGTLLKKDEKLESDIVMIEKAEQKLPSYIPVYNRMYQDLIDGVYEKDSLLPSETVLAAAYKVSRNTLRQALTILCQDGYIYKRQGKGTYVSYDCHRRKISNIYNFLVDCAKEPIHHVTIDYNVGVPTLIAKEKLRLGLGEEILASNNVYWSEEAPVGQAFLQVPVSLLKNLGISLDSEEALKQFMKAHLYQQAVTGEMTIQVAQADEQVVSYMKIAEGTVLLHIEQILYGREGLPAARVKYYFLPEKYQVDCRLQT